jgi:hypothetical protein
MMLPQQVIYSASSVAERIVGSFHVAEKIYRYTPHSEN